MNFFNSVIENFNRQDKKQKILLFVLVVVFVITIFVIYNNFLKKPDVLNIVNGESEIKPLDLKLKILDSDVFNSLKIN